MENCIAAHARIYVYNRHTASVFEMLITGSSFPSFIHSRGRGGLGMEKEVTTFYERLADMFSRKLKKPYSVVT